MDDVCRIEKCITIESVSSRTSNFDSVAIYGALEMFDLLRIYNFRYDHNEQYTIPPNFFITSREIINVL